MIQVCEMDGPRGLRHIGGLLASTSGFSMCESHRLYILHIATTILNPMDANRQSRNLSRKHAPRKLRLVTLKHHQRLLSQNTLSAKITLCAPMGAFTSDKCVPSHGVSLQQYNFGNWTHQFCCARVHFCRSHYFIHSHLVAIPLIKFIHGCLRLS